MSERDFSGIEELYGEHLDDLDEEWYPVFSDLTSQGNSPVVVRATIEWLTTYKYQTECAEEYDISAVSIRNFRDEITEKAPEGVEIISPLDKRKRRNATRELLIAEISEYIDWEEGVHYTTSRQNSIYINKPGLIDIYDIVTGEEYNGR